MKPTFACKRLLPVLLALALCVLCCACGDSSPDRKQQMLSLYGENKPITGDYDKTLAVSCSNGVFVGKEAGGVRAYKGIPFAEPPTGALRWKPPVPAKDGDGVFEAYYFGASPVQTEWPSEPGSYYPQSEDCLKLNVWTSGSGKNKCVMVFFHGGSYGWGATSDPIYDGENFVRAHPDVVLVTVEYRLGIFGFIDFSAVPGGDAYKESGNLGLLDMVCALQWLRKNVGAFGGAADNVTVFGESAGGGAVSLLPLMAGTRGLFRRAIAESGSVALTYGRDECQRLTQMLLQETGCETMEELTALPEEALKQANEALNDYNNFPERDGVVLPEDLYGAYARGDAAHVDLLIGSNADEARYWTLEMGYYAPGVSGETIYKLLIPVMFESNIKPFSDADRAAVKTFMALQSGKRAWRITEFYNDVLFRVPAAFQAQVNTEHGGKAFVYYWTYPSAIGSLGACHAVELAYVFNNLDQTIYTGDNVDPELAAAVQTMWVNFAKTGDPSTAELAWPVYDGAHRTSMVLGSGIHTENGVLEQRRVLMEPLLNYGLNGCYTTLNFNVPTVWRYAAVAAAVLLALAAALVVLIRRSRKKKHRKTDGRRRA